MKGQSLIEILVAIALAAVLIPALFLGLLASREGRAQRDQRLDASFLVKEGAEAVRSVKERDWSSFAINGTYHPEISGSLWVLNSGPENINGFTRQTIISDVFRDGVLDPSTKKIEISVSWPSPILSSATSIFYLTRSNNNVYTQTSMADFNAGLKNGVAVTNTSGGEIILGAGGHGDWCSPNQFIIEELDLPKNGVANTISAYEGRAIVGTGENASGVSLADINITNSNPPVASIAGTFNNYKTNGVFINGNYAYIATDDNQKEIVIVDLTTHLEVGNFNAPGNSDATSVFVSENKGYATTGFFLYIFDLSSNTGTRPALGSYFFLGIATSVTVNGNYAYVSLAYSPIEMQIIDISNPQTLLNVGWADVNGTDGKRIFVNSTGTRAYLATGASTSRREFFIIDITQKTGSRPIIGSYEANGMNPSSLSVVPGNKAIMVGSGGEEYQVIDITQETNPVRCGGLNIDSGIRGVVGVLEADGDAYSYIATGDLYTEFKIIEGGPGGQFSENGIFTSETFDATVSSTFNRFYVTAEKPQNTNITYQIGIADAVNNSCNDVSFEFVGPDLTDATYFSTGSAIPIKTNGTGYKNPGRCLKYKSFLSTSDFTQSPTLYDINFNYSP